ncbi:TPA: toxin Bro, partial [Clostridioides difficile]|nr:toxin Bro [Clostridioides difficile]
MNNELMNFENNELGIKIRTIKYEDGSIGINAEDTAVGFGWCK